MGRDMDSGESYLLPASTLTPAGPLRGALSRRLEGFRGTGTPPRLLKEASPDAGSTSGRASEATVVPLEPSFASDGETKVEWLRQELERCQAERTFAEESQRELEARVECQRQAFEAERQQMLRRMAHLESERRRDPRRMRAVQHVCGRNGFGDGAG
ncbi:unnamed protein product [Effrenium voratum]|nr:unnamed protein product [Effrenium voratum]